MKKITLGFSLLVASTFIFLSCGKKTPNVAPIADTEVQTAIDATFANFIITDIDMVASFVCEDDFHPKFYLPKAGYTPMAAARDESAKTLAVGYNGATRCADGHIRQGSIFLRYGLNTYFDSTPPPNTKYYRDFGFTVALSFSNYKVDGILIENVDPTRFLIIRNTRSSAKKPITDIGWTIEGKLKFTDSLSSTANMTWEGSLVKKIKNLPAAPTTPTTSQIWNNTATGNTAITWSATIVEYTGSFHGVTSYSVPYESKIYDATPLVRDFSCYPDKISAVNLTPTVTTVYEEFHPFISGVASFTTSKPTKIDSLPLYPREIYFDNTENSYGGISDPLSLPAQCDNKGAVQIKGIYYPIDFKK